MVPPLYDLGDDIFEDLCRELAQEEEGVDNVERYGTRGQRQLGVDLLIEFKDDSLAAGQCKAHQHCDEALIRTACDEFLRHAEHWRKEGIRTFILFLAADTRRTQLHDERLRQRGRLRQEGFSFKVWSGAVFKAKLRKRRLIVRHFLPLLETYICGPSAKLDFQSSFQEATILALARQLGEVAEGDQAELRQLWRDGHPTAALSKLRTIKAETLTWAVLPPPTKSKLLCLEGRLVLTTGDIATAKRLASEADQLDGSGSGRARLVAMIAQAEGRLDDAIAALEHDTDPDSQALKAAVQIQAGQIDLALETLSSLVDHPDAHRLRSLVFLSRREGAKAKAEAEKALSLAPTSYWIRRTAATVRYLAGLSPIVLPRGFPDWPEPINLTFVRQDDESVAARRSAALEFERLSGPEFEHSADDLACLQSWRVACLADNPDSRHDATELARAVLDTNPSNYRVMTWVLGRALDVSVDSTVGVLEERVAHHQASVEEILSLVAAYTTADRFLDARAVLEQTKDVFNRDSAQRLWDYWQSQLAAIGTDAEGASPVTAEAQVEQVIARLRSAEATGEREVSWRQCMLLAQLGRWEEIAPRAAELVASFQTPDAARIASHALYNTRDFLGCLAIIDRAPALFFKGELPPDLRRLRVLAQRATGALPEAIRAAREVFEQSPTRDALLELARLYYQVGDFKSLAIVARRHATLIDLSAIDYLTLAFYVTIEDPSIALALWRKAVAQGIDDDHVGMAFEIANSLAVGVELKPLAQRMAVLGREGRGGVQAVGLKELIDWSVRRREHLEQVWQQLRRGEVPNHTALHIIGIGLATAFHRVPLITAARTDGTSAGAVNQRFGGRITGSLPVASGQRWRLNADVTAILNAANFGLLPQIETEFAPIRVPQNTIVALTGMQNRLRPSQPAHLEARRRVLSAVLAGRITRLDLEPITARQESDGDVATDVLQILHDAVANDSLVLEFLPVRAMDPMEAAVSLPAHYAVILRDAHSVVDALEHCGALSGPEHLRAREALGERGGLPTEAAIPPGKRLVCRTAVVKLLALAGVLELATATFKLVIPTDELDRDQRDVDNAAIADSDADWVGGLIDRIREGLTTGTYAILPQTAPGKTRPTEGREPTPEETVLLDLMQFPGGDLDVIWTDDRWTSSHEHRDGIRIAGTVDLLFWLRGADRIAPATWADALINMRAADVRFIAFDADELLAALLEAPIEHGKLVETKPLRVLRQYYARCLLEADVLRPPTATAGLPLAATEWNYLLGCGLAVVTAMVRVWETGPNDHAMARAEWLFRNMYTDDRGIHGTAAPRTEGNDAYRTGVSLVSLIATSIRLDGQEDFRQARRDYLAWLYQRGMRGRFAADRDLALAVVEQLKATLTQGLEKDDTAMEAITLRLMGRLWSDLPMEVRKLMEPDEEFLQALRVSMRSIVGIGPLRVDRHRFWDSLSRILRDRAPADVATVDGHVVRLELVSDNPPMVAARCDALQFDGQIGGHEFGLLSESFAERETSAARLAHWFDVPKSRRQELTARIIGGQDPGTRIELATDARMASGEDLYRRLFESITAGATFRPMDAMPSDPRVLMDHLRINETDTSSNRWAESAEELVGDVGVVAAAQRLGGLPIALPDTFVKAIVALSAQERRRALRTIRRIWLGSPVGLVQLADLWRRLPHYDRHVSKLRIRLAGALCNEGLRPEFDAWLATLQWVDEQFGFNESMRALPNDIRVALVWTHADRLFRTLLSRGLTAEWIGHAFGQSEYAVAPELVFPHVAYTGDVAAPRRLRAEAFALAGLAVICIDESVVKPVQAVLATTLEGMNELGRAKLFRAMMVDSGGAPNVLGSWLANERRWLSVFPEDIRKNFTSEAIAGIVDEACKGIVGKIGERPSWFNLLAVLGEAPPPESTRLALEKVLLSVNLADYVSQDGWLAVAALDLIGSQARYLSAESRARSETQLLEVAAKCSHVKLEAELQEALYDSILTGLIGCTWWKPDRDGRAAALGSLFERLASGDSSAVFLRSGRFILRLCDALPVSQARHLWRARDLLRLGTRL